MDIGGALQEARRDFGLTVEQLSERTRIRTAIIRAIERGDFAMCGADFYARGHIKAMARAVSIDPAPLVAQYDRDRAGLGTTAGATAEPAPGDPAPAEHEPADAGPAAAAAAQSRPLMAAGATAVPPRQPAAAQPEPGGLTAAEVFRPAMPLHIAPARRLPRRTPLYAAAGLAVIAVVAYLLVSAASSPSTASQTAAAGPPASQYKPPSPPAAPSLQPSPPAPAAQPLPITGAEAFGPDGPGQGDNPQSAAFSVDGSTGTTWHTDWYARADLNGQGGTGLLLNMGKPVLVSTVQLALGPGAGGTVQLRTGDSPAMASLQTVGESPIPGGTVTITAGTSERAQYVLIWFTQLPADGTGTFQAYVNNVVVSGTS